MAEMSRLRRQDGRSMLVSMTPTNKWWALLVVLTLGFWAGGAAAQSDDDSGWFDESDTSERPQLKIQGKGQYDPPPPDFRSEPAAPSPTGPEAIAEEEPADDADVEDADSQRRAVSEFSPHLAPYGYWVDDPYYGRVWVPSRGVVGSEFRPYVSGGHWELTADDEWLWASDYPFGWVTFHYGRWAWLSGGVGWGWVPGHVYSPAWVDFRVGSSGYVGWGPAPPYSVWRGGLFVSLGWRRPVPYIFCPTTYVFSSSLPRYVVYDRYRVRSIAAQTYRYRPRHVAGAVRVRGPSPREARIPNRYVPSRRVIAQPRGGYVASEYRGRGNDTRRYESRRLDSGGNDYRSRDSRRDSRGRDYARSQRLRSPDESRHRSVPRERTRERAGDGRRDGRSRFEGANMAPSRRMQGSPPPSRGTARQGWAAPSGGARQSEPRQRPERREAAPPRARDDGARTRAPERSSGAAERRSDNRRPSASPARSSRGGGASQQRSRSNGRDNR
jgi:hypothetical protein